MRTRLHRGLGGGLGGLAARAFVAAGSVLLATGGVCGLAGAAFGQTAPAQATPAGDAAKRDADAGYSRVRDSDEGATVELQIVARAMVPSDPTKPVIELVGVTHIGDAAYYKALQEFLDGQDLVLFEGVKPPGSDAGKGDAKEKTDKEKVEQTTHRLRMLAILTERYRRDQKDIPESLDALVEGLSGPAKRMAKGSLKDSWGHAIAYKPAPAGEAVDGKTPRRTFDLVSLGSDGAEGGEGTGADLKFSAQEPLSKDEKTGGGGMQENLAHSLGLEFQLLAIDYDRKNWRNSDMSIDQVQHDLAELGASGDMLFKMLDGSSLSAKVVNLVLAFVRSSPTMAANAKVMLMEALANADGMMGGAAGGGAGAGAGLDNMNALMKVIVGHRNDAVLADLKAALAENVSPARRSIALFYGAGHLPDMSAKLREMGYTPDPAQDKWFTAIRVNATESGIPAQQIKMMRDMVRNSMGQMKPAKPAAATPGESPVPAKQ